MYSKNKILTLLLIMFSGIVLSAQQLPRPTDEIGVTILRNVKYEVTGAIYTNGAEEGFRYTIMGVRTGDSLVAAPPKPEFIVKRGEVPDTIGIGTAGTNRAVFVSENVGVSANIFTDTLGNTVLPFAVEVYTSADSSYQGVPTDTLLGSYTVPSILYAGDTLHTEIPLYVPIALDSGWHTLLFVIDRDTNRVGEYNDSTNNVRVVRGYFEPCDSIAFPDSIIHATCGFDNASIALTPKQGSRYTWSNGSSAPAIYNLNAGTYALTITDRKGCTASKSYLVGDTPPVALSSSQNPVRCNQPNGAAAIQVSGGTIPFVYQWSNGAIGASLSNLAAGFYTCTVTDAVGCSGLGGVDVLSIPAPIANLTATLAQCGGYNAAVNCTAMLGTLPYQYLWSTGATTAQLTGLTEGTYTLTLTDADGCTVSDDVVVHSTPALGATGTVNTVLSTLTATHINGTFPFQYQWSNGSNSNMIQVPLTGTYTVTVTDANGCTATWSFSTVGVSDGGNQYGLVVYPNPTDGLIRIAFDVLPAHSTVGIYMLDGTLVKQENIAQTTGEILFNLSGFASQTFNLVLKTKDGETIYTTNVVLNK